MERLHYEAYISEFVVVELEEGEYPGKSKALSLVRDIPRLAANRDIQEIAGVYLVHKLMPSVDVRDALHLAFASNYKMDYLLTWNCAHLANGHKRRHIRVINTRLGLWTPEIVTPLELVPPKEEPE
jgi:predicted nucleic acid-binding protein